MAQITRNNVMEVLGEQVMADIVTDEDLACIKTIVANSTYGEDMKNVDLFMYGYLKGISANRHK